MRIPEAKIEEIRSSANILDVISGYVQLSKRGRNFIGLCPFHHEKTPSFTVSEEKQIYHCFGCHAGGNVFKFLMEYKNISFIEAVTEVADMVGIKLDMDEGNYSEEQSEQEKLYEINVIAAKFFSNTLFKEDAGEIGRKYFDGRKINLQTQRAFGLGFAPDSWDKMVSHLKSNGVDLIKAKDLGLIDAKDGGSFYDKFRGRVIFPIFSPNGRVIAFGGRILEKSDRAAKYLNSPESLIYHKRRSLYGLSHAKDEIRKLNKVILVEGYMDLISLYQHGIQNVVASSGTALTDEQVQLLSRFTKNITVLFDSDVAGQKASMRSIEILLKQEFDVRVMSLPEGEDPDSYINSYGRDEFEKQLKKANDFLEYQTAQFDAAGMFSDPNTQTTAIRELVKSAALVRDELKRKLLIKSIAKKFNLREMLIESELDKFLDLGKKKEREEAQRPRYVHEQIKSEQPEIDINDSQMLFEKELVKLLFEGKEEIIGNIFDLIDPEEFKNSVLRSIALSVLDCYKNDIIEPSVLIDKIEDDSLREFARTLSITNESISPNWARYAFEGNIEPDMVAYCNDLLKNFRIRKLDEQIKANSRKLATITDEEEILDLMKFNQDLEREKKAILACNGTGHY